MIDEGPSPEDLQRFGGEYGYCPQCSGEIWDAAEFCPECGAHVGGHTSSRPPVDREFRGKWFILIAIIILVFFLIRTL